MRSLHLVIAVTVAAGMVVSGCGSVSAETPSATVSGSTTTSAAASSNPSTSAPPTSAAATGTLSTAPHPCTGLELPKGLKRQKTMRPLACTWESATDYVLFAVGREATTFDIAKSLEQSNSNGKTVIEQVPAEGWSFGARWPSDGSSLLRVQRWLVDAKGQVLLCKMGSERGEAGIAELVDVCEQAKTALFTA